jgi:hypothetical protein
MGTTTTAARAWLYAAQHHFEVLGSSKVIILTAGPCGRGAGRVRVWRRRHVGKPFSVPMLMQRVSRARPAASS